MPAAEVFVVTRQTNGDGNTSRSCPRNNTDGVQVRVWTGGPVSAKTLRSKPGKIAMRLIVVRRSSVSIAFRREVLFEDGHRVDNAIEVPRLILPAQMVNGIAIWMFVPITAQEGIYGVDRLAQHCGQVFNGAKRTGRC